jgi:hypothetical protein
MYADPDPFLIWTFFEFIENTEDAVERPGSEEKRLLTDTFRISCRLLFNMVDVWIVGSRARLQREEHVAFRNLLTVKRISIQA